MGKSQSDATVGRGNQCICTSIEWSILDSKAKHAELAKGMRSFLEGYRPYFE